MATVSPNSFLDIPLPKYTIFHISWNILPPKMLEICMLIPIYPELGINGASTTPETDRQLRIASIPSLDPEADTPESLEQSESDLKLGSESKAKRRIHRLDRSRISTETSTLEFLLNLPPAKRPYVGVWGDILYYFSLSRDFLLRQCPSSSRNILSRAIADSIIT
jgi:hypothetical protein